MILTSLSEPDRLQPVNAQMLRLLRQIDEAQARLDRLVTAVPEAAAQLAVASRIESVIASNELESVRTDPRRAERLIRAQLEPETTDECEIAGYRAAFDEIIAYRAESLSAPRLLHWHRELFSHGGPEIAGRFKRHNNRVQNPDGSDRFKTVPAAIAERATLMVID